MSIPPTFPYFFYDIGYYHVNSFNGVQGIVPLFNKKYIKWGKMHNFRAFSSLNVYVDIISGRLVNRNNLLGG